MDTLFFGIYKFVSCKKVYAPAATVTAFIISSLWTAVRMGVLIDSLRSELDDKYAQLFRD